MPFDGVTVNSLVHELNNTILNGKIEKIYQPEKDEITLNIRSNKINYKLLISVSPMYPKIHLTEDNKSNPMNAPTFCMLLRKHLIGSRIVNIKQPSLERVVELTCDCIDEMGYNAKKTIIVEVMGRHSNLIFMDGQNMTIIDSIRRVSNDMSSVRTILPGLKYVYPPSNNKKDPFNYEENEFFQDISSLTASIKADRYFVKTFYGISPIMAQEICFRAGIESDLDMKTIDEEQRSKLFSKFSSLIKQIRNQDYRPNIIMEESRNIDFSALELSIYKNYKIINIDSISKVIETFYSQKDKIDRTKQKTSDLNKVVKTRLERSERKLSILEKELSDARNSKHYRICGDIIMANLYRINKGEEKVSLPNFYSEKEETIEIALDPRLSPNANAQKYYKQYNKSKVALKLLTIQMEQVLDEIIYLESILDSLNKSSEETEINEIKQELVQEGYLKKAKENKKNTKSSQKPSKPMHFVSSSGFDIYVGKNNIQNDYLTLKFATANDLWFHTKDIPGSHVILKLEGKKPDDNALMEAANLAAYYSKGKLSSNVPVDYTWKKNVKKPSGAKPGKVIYENNKTIYITPDEEKVKNMKIRGLV
ncbi:MAG: NFACT RNA binding domain-containing protein [Lutispora sp.]|nr:NFACT RNA binding domain-containing protein [Lutispora sp.]